MTQQPRKKKAVESVKIDKEFRRIVETTSVETSNS